MTSTVPLRLTAFVAVLAAVFGVAFLTGSQWQLLTRPPTTEHHGVLTGLSPSDGGYTLTSPETGLGPGDDQFVELGISGPGGGPVPALDEVDAASVHLIAFRRDLTGYQHVYPEQGEGVSWWALLNLTPGPWHLVVELQPSALGRELTLATDLTVRGAYAPNPLDPAAPTADAGDGLTVTRSGALTTDPDGLPSVTVSAAGQPVTDLQPAHGELGHVVVIRPSDLAFLHLHAVAASTTGPRLLFTGGVPGRGTYVMFVEFSRDDTVHVARFTTVVDR